MERFQFAVVQDQVSIDAESELNFKVIEPLLIIAGGIDPGAFSREHLLFEAAQIRLRDAPLLSERAAALGVFAGTLQIEEYVAGHVPVAQHAVISSGDLDAKIFAVAGKIAEIIKKLAFGLGQVFEFQLEPRVAQEGPHEGGGELRLSDGARIAGDKADEIGGHRRGKPANVANEPTGAHEAGSRNALLLDQIIADNDFG